MDVLRGGAYNPLKGGAAVKRYFAAFIFCCVLLSGAVTARAGLSDFVDTLRARAAGGEALYTGRLPSVDESLPVRRILFIGNSYTYYHAMPDMIPWIAASVKGEKFRYIVEAVTMGGAHLIDFAGKRDLLEKVARPGYDVLVLQDQSFVPLNDAATRTDSVLAIQAFASAASKAGAAVLLYGTWPRRAGDAIYKQSAALQSPEDMQGYIDRHYALAAQSSGAQYLPVGNYRLRAVRQNPSLYLYENDGSHPNLQGSYFSALVLYRAISGNSPVQAAWAPDGMAAGEANALRAAASENGP
jgi:hypothetical protein